jgi:hypothetical protein
MEELEPRLLFSADLPGVLAQSGLLGGEAEPTPPAIVTLVDAPAVGVTIGNSGESNAESGFSLSQPKSSTQVQKELVFVDAGAPNYKQLINDLLTAQAEGRPIEVVVLETERRDVGAVHIVSHGSDGNLQLGNAKLNAYNLESYRDAIKSWQVAMTEGADLLIYGCDFAGSAQGREMVETLSALTGADVAASNDKTGAAAAGGDWDLEYKLGDIETDVALSLNVQQSWEHTLAVTEDLTSFGGSSGAPISVNHTTSGTDRLMMVGVSMNLLGSETVNTVQWNGTDLTFFDAVVNGDAVVELWYMVAPEVGNFDVDVTFTSSPDGATVGVTTFNGVDQSTPLGVFDTGTGTGGTASANIISATGELVYAVVAVDDPTDYDLNTGGQTELFDAYGAEISGGGITEAAAASVPVSWTWSGSDDWAIGAVSIKPSSGAGTHSISGTINEDVNGDSSLADAAGLNNVRVRLFQDGGDGLADGVDDTFVTSALTSGGGAYSFTGLTDDTYWVVVDSTTIFPTQGTAAPSSVWAEQTYGVAGAMDGAASFLGTSGALYGGRDPNASDLNSNSASDLDTSEHVTRVILAGADVTNIDSGFSFNVVTNVRGDGGDDDGVGTGRHSQGTLDQFIMNANLVNGANAMRFVPAVAPNVVTGSFSDDGNYTNDGGDDWWQINVTSVLSPISGANTTIDGTAYSHFDGTIVADTNTGHRRRRWADTGSGRSGRARARGRQLVYGRGAACHGRWSDHSKSGD